MEEPVHGGAQCEEHAGGGAVQLGEVQLHRGLLTGLAGGRRGSPVPARKHQTGMRPTLCCGNPPPAIIKCRSTHVYLCCRVAAIKYTSFSSLQRRVCIILLAGSTQVSNHLLDLQHPTKDIPVVALPWLPHCHIHIPAKN